MRGDPEDTARKKVLEQKHSNAPNTSHYTIQSFMANNIALAGCGTVKDYNLNPSAMLCAHYTVGVSCSTYTVGVNCSKIILRVWRKDCLEAFLPCMT